MALVARVLSGTGLVLGIVGAFFLYKGTDILTHVSITVDGHFPKDKQAKSWRWSKAGLWCIGVGFFLELMALLLEPIDGA